MHPRPKILGLCLVASTIAAAAQTVTTSGGTTNTVPLFTGKTTIGNSIITQSDDHVGIGTKTPAATLDVDGATIFRNTLTALSGNATSSATVNSPIFILSGSAYNSSSKAAVTQKFGWQTVPNGNDTSAPSANLKLFFGTGTESLAQTGFAISSKGLITFAPGQTFPGGTGTGTITKVTAGTGLTGGGSSGAVTLNVDSTKVPLLATSNTFAGSNKFTALQTFEQSVTGLQGFVGENSQSGFVALEGDDYSNSGVGVRGLSYNQGSGYDGWRYLRRILWGLRRRRAICRGF